jgi:hypothetical protein
MRRVPLLLALLALAGCGGGGAGKPKSTSTAAAPAKRLSVVVRGENHHPLVGKKWHYEVRVTAGGKPVSCRIHLQFLFSGAPVGEVGRHALAHGVWRETFGVGANPPFPPASRGQSLVLEATATKPGYRSGRAGWAVLPR